MCVLASKIERILIYLLAPVLKTLFALILALPTVDEEQDD